MSALWGGRSAPRPRTSASQGENVCLAGQTSWVDPPRAPNRLKPDGNRRRNEPPRRQGRQGRLEENKILAFLACPWRLGGSFLRLINVIGALEVDEMVPRVGVERQRPRGGGTPPRWSATVADLAEPYPWTGAPRPWTARHPWMALPPPAGRTVMHSRLVERLRSAGAPGTLQRRRALPRSQSCGGSPPAPAGVQLDHFRHETSARLAVGLNHQNHAVHPLAQVLLSPDPRAPVDGYPPHRRTGARFFVCVSSQASPA
jgi:hypothetical protein